MKRFAIGLLLCFATTMTVVAGKAYPYPHTYVQPDGTSIVLYAQGDEFSHSLTNAEGEPVQRMADGFYRTIATDRPASNTPQLRPINTEPEHHNLQRLVARRDNRQPRSFRGLVVLVAFNDQSFRFSDNATRQLYDGMLNGVNYRGYSDRLYGGFQPCTGSVRDYFVDNSYGQFVPHFDIVGPITLNHPCTYMNTVERTYPMMEEILAQVNDSVDYSLYDTNGDGDLDMVYVIYAGYSSMYQGNDERLPWPHATTMVDPAGDTPDIIYDGVRMARFACSTELYGWQQEGDLMIDGIGTIVHEFSHVLGFQDHYDTSAGYQEHPNSWDVMDGGNYSEDYNRTPCAYNSFEKAAAGFLTPLDITNLDGDSVVLRSTETSTDALVLHSQQEHVHFYMENRQRNKWDRFLVGHGMLVWRVDSVHPEYWTSNIINVTTRACFRLVRAQGTQGSFFTGVVDTEEDPFPGTTNVTLLDNQLDRAANLISYDQYPTLAVLQGITETDSVIRMMVVRDTLSDGRPINYDLVSHFHATAERLVGDEWVPVEWDVTHVTMMLNNQETEVIYNLLPNTQNVVQTNSTVTGQFFMPYTLSAYNELSIQARRLCLTSDYGIWLANLTDVEAGGGGSMRFSTGRHGVPVLEGENTQLGLLAMQTSSFAAVSSNVISVLERYRNIRFSEQATEDALESITTGRTSAVKELRDGRIVIIRDGVTYTITGQIINH